MNFVLRNVKNEFCVENVNEYKLFENFPFFDACELYHVNVLSLECRKIENCISYPKRTCWIATQFLIGSNTPDATDGWCRHTAAKLPASPFDPSPLKGRYSSLQRAKAACRLEITVRCL